MNVFMPRTSYSIYLKKKKAQSGLKQPHESFLPAIHNEIDGVELKGAENIITSQEQLQKTTDLFLLSFT